MRMETNQKENINDESDIENIVDQTKLSQTAQHWVVTKYRNFPCRVNHATVYSPYSKKIYSFGGYCSKHLISDTVNANPLESMDIQCLDPFLQGDDWRYLQHPKKVYCSSLIEFNQKPNDFLTGEDHPVPRFGHAAVTYKDKIYVIGGYNVKLSQPPALMFCYDIPRNVWFTPKCYGKVPLERDAHACCYEGNLAFLHGGIERSRFSVNLGYSNQLYMLDMDTINWVLLPSNGCISEMNLIFHSLVCFGKEIYCFGGEFLDLYFGGIRDYSNNVYRYNYSPEKCFWERLETVGKAPEGRRSHSCIKYRNNMIVFGGGSKTSCKHFNDIFMFNIDSKLWVQLIPWGNAPLARRRAGTCLIGSTIFIYGGASPSEKTIKENVHQNTFTSKSDNFLVDLNDTHILELEPSLKMKCVFVIINNNLLNNSLFHSLPATFQEQIKDFHGVTITSGGNVGPNQKA